MLERQQLVGSRRDVLSPDIRVERPRVCSSQHLRIMSFCACVILIAVLVAAVMVGVAQSDVNDNNYEQDPTYWHNMAQKELEDTLRERPRGVAKNVIFFLGDGMGPTTVTAARILAGQLLGFKGEEQKLSFDKFPFTGLSRTYNVDHQITDSAASGTAYLTGVKTNQGLLGLSGAAIRKRCNSTEGAHVDSILRWSLNAGKSAGIVTTARVTHASPGAAYSHSADRDWESDRNIPHAEKDCADIALQLISDNNDINVVMGGGRAYFYPVDAPDPEPDPTFNTSKVCRADGRNLIQEWQDIMASKKARHRFVHNKKGFDSVDSTRTDYLLGLFTQSHMSYELDRNKTKEPSIADMTEKAIQILKKNSKGFFLFVEGGRIDHGHHDTRPAHALHEVVAMAQAVEVATKLTDPFDTLIVVSADHSHVMNLAGYATRGNPILGLSDNDDKVPSLAASDKKPYTTLLYGNGPGYREPRPNITGVDTESKNYVSQSAVPFKSETHGGEDVGIFAQGPQSFLYSGVHEQNYIPMVMAYASCVGPYAEGKKPCAKHESGSTGQGQGSSSRAAALSTAGIVLTCWSLGYVISKSCL
ncbi:unnamed protein product [Lymnaea stagnalis]|uniref:Alkaline phosphatase n=1 Tax=Lymnaea stagnalis TaxID=6523 RepID=A0AAV2HHF6_LYMST